MGIKRIIVGLTVPLLLLGVCLSSGESISAFKRDLVLENWQKVILDEFRQNVSEIVSQEYMKEEINLVRWLRARHWDVDAATKMLVQNLEWRKANKIDSILEEDWVEFSKKFPYQIHSFSNGGKPILTWDMGTWDIRTVVLSGNMSQLARYTAKLYEDGASSVRRLQQNGKNVTQYEILVDVDQYNVVRQGCLQCIPYFAIAMSIYENYFPGSVENFILINTPLAYEVPLRAMLSAMSSRTRSSFHVIGRNSPQSRRAPLGIESGDYESESTF